MRTNEARVFIVEDTERKLAELTTLVQITGGEVVGSVNNLSGALDIMQSSDFPASITDANVVLLDGNLSLRDSGGHDGADVFRAGYRHGRLHKVDEADGIGAVAIGCSIARNSLVVRATGGNVQLSNNETSDQSSWQELLVAHPAEPTYLTDGIINRQQFYGTDLTRVLVAQLSFDPSADVTLHRFDTKDTVITRHLAMSDTKVEYEGKLDEPTSMTLIKLAELMRWSRSEDRDLERGDSYDVQAVFKSSDQLYVIKHAVKVLFGEPEAKTTEILSVDSLPLVTIDQVPDSFWNNLGFELATIL